MIPHWQPPASARPVHGWGIVTGFGPGQRAELISVPAGSSLAIGSLTFSDSSPPDPAGAVTLQFETAAPASRASPVA